MRAFILPLSRRVVRRIHQLVSRGLVRESGTTRRVVFPILLLDPDMANAVQLAARLETAGFPTRVEGTTYAALQILQKEYFATLIVIADLDNADCLARLDDLRCSAARTWMVIVNPRCDINTCDLIRRHGGDACITSPVSMEDLARRLSAFQLRSRPIF